MTTFDIAVILAGICGLFMVIGGMVLLYKGAISLSQASKEEAVNLEFKKMLRITTHYPALGLFVIGLAFIIIAVSFSKSTQNQFKISGHVKGVDDLGSLKVLITVPGWAGETYADGQILASINPRMDILEVRLASPGYREIKIPVETRKSKLGTISIGDVTFGNKVVEKPVVNQNNIKPVAQELPPLSAPAAF